MNDVYKSFGANVLRTLVKNRKLSINITGRTFVHNFERPLTKFLKVFSFTVDGNMKLEASLIIKH